MSVLIKGGRVITAADDYIADVYVEDERIALLGASLDLVADQVIDARGKYVLPGCIDVHTHMEVLSFGAWTCDDFTSGTIAAAFGGTTTIIDFVEPGPNETISQGLATWQEKLRRKKPVVDVGFHMIVDDLDGDALEEIRTLGAEGITSIKLFMAYKGGLMVDDDTLFRTMLIGAETGAIVMVHAENGDAIDVLIEVARNEGKFEPRYHAATRPPASEAEAVYRAIHLARLAGCSLYVVHVSCGEAVDAIAGARACGFPVWGETCTQYLFIDQADLAKPGFEGAKYVFTPPARTEHDRQRLWDALATDALSVISTDHSPFFFDGGKTVGREDFSKIPNGVGGVEERLMLIHEAGVRGGRITLNRMVELLATNPAKLFGLYPKKGSVAIGSDADLVIFDPEKRRTIAAASQHSLCDYSLFEGYSVHGAPDAVLVRGSLVIDGEDLIAEPGHGRFIRRAKFRERLDSPTERPLAPI